MNNDGVKDPSDIWIGQRDVRLGGTTHTWDIAPRRVGSGEWHVSVRITDPQGASSTSTSEGTVRI